MDEAESEVLPMYMSVPGFWLVGERPLCFPHHVSIADLEMKLCCYCAYQQVGKVLMSLF